MAYYNQNTPPAINVNVSGPPPPPQGSLKQIHLITLIIFVYSLLICIFWTIDNDMYCYILLTVNIMILFCYRLPCLNFAIFFGFFMTKFER